MSQQSSLNRSQRTADLADVAAQSVDVLVIGLGATGAGVALDAASRGLRVLAVDKADLASGTSSKSSKMVHGGLRYLENYEFSLVREGVLERQLLTEIAPHLVRTTETLFPVWPDTAKRRLLRAGLATYDVLSAASLSGSRRASAHRKISIAEAVRRVPSLAGQDLIGCYTYVDGVTDDARLVLAVARAAKEHGAAIATYTEVIGLTADQHGRTNGATLRDNLTATTFTVRARHVVNATGVWVDTVQQMEDPDRQAVVQPSKGVHLVVPAARLPLGASVLMPSKQGDGRIMFAHPWGKQVLIGTTDTLYDGDVDNLSVTEADLEYVLAASNAVFNRNLGVSDVIGAWAGVRPLVKQANSASASDISRRHTLVEGHSGVLTITGGKLTTYRRMAKDVVDKIVLRDGLTAPCRTERISLSGTAEPAGLRETAVTQARQIGLDADTAVHLLRQSSGYALNVLSLIEHDPALAAQLTPDLPYLYAEVVHAVRCEGAVTLEDLLARRLRVSLRDAAAGAGAFDRISKIWAAETKDSSKRIKTMLADYLRAVRSERGAVPLAEKVL